MPIDHQTSERDHTGSHPAGIYTMPIAQYVADPAIAPSFNTSMAMAMLTQSPMHAKMQHPRLNPAITREESSRLDIGSIAHALLLENDRSKIVAVPADDWRTKAAKEQRDAARAEGKIPILEKDLSKVAQMVEIAAHALTGSELCEDWFLAKAEQTLLWEERPGVWCRSRPDKLTPDGKVLFEYKTAASASPTAFAKTAINQGYDLQVALASRGVAALCRVEPAVVFVAQEIDEPYAVSFIRLSPMFLAIAGERLELALDKWERCLKADRWPGYDERVATVDPPGWYGMDQVEGM